MEPNSICISRLIDKLIAFGENNFNLALPCVARIQEAPFTNMD